jgi:hypothetical protein
VTPHGTLMSVGLHHSDAKQVYVAARYGEVFGTQDGGESWLEMLLPQGVQHIYHLLESDVRCSKSTLRSGLRGDERSRMAEPSRMAR